MVFTSVLSSKNRQWEQSISSCQEFNNFHTLSSFPTSAPDSKRRTEKEWLSKAWRQSARQQSNTLVYFRPPRHRGVDAGWGGGVRDCGVRQPENEHRPVTFPIERCSCSDSTSACRLHKARPVNHLTAFCRTGKKGERIESRLLTPTRGRRSQASGSDQGR